MPAVISGEQAKLLLALISPLEFARLFLGFQPNEATVRGFSAVSMLVIDEASRVEDSMYEALFPCLGTVNGDAILLSTPMGKRGEFHRVMTEGERWLRHTGPVTECARISPAFLERERARGETYFRREYLCEFLETGTHLLEETLVRRAVKVQEEPWRQV